MPRSEFKLTFTRSKFIRRELNIEILEHRITFRDAFREMLESVPVSFEEAKEVLKKSAYSLLPFEHYYTLFV